MFHDKELTVYDHNSLGILLLGELVQEVGHGLTKLHPIGFGLLGGAYREIRYTHWFDVQKNILGNRFREPALGQVVDSVLQESTVSLSHREYI